MKFGVNTLLWCGSFENKHLKFIDKAKEIGFDGIEMAVFDTSAIDAKKVKARLEANGLEGLMCAVMPFDGNGDLTSSVKSERQLGIDKIKGTIDWAADAGAHTICGPIHMHVGAKPPENRKPPQRNKAEWNNCVSSLKVLGKHAAPAGIKLAIEPLNRFETYFLNTGADTVQLCKEVGEPNVTYHYDTFHANIEEKDPVGVIKKSAKHVGHVHLSESDRGIPGSGHVDWVGVFTTLKKIKYDDWLVIESFVPQVPEIAAATCIWRPLAKSGDELASKGLKFLKRTLKKL
jgi:D-psicose/D-tagatose/L-ribulose 3-epimerase